MIQIRQGVFETNSSSTHSICIASKDEYQDWIDGKVYYIAESYFCSEKDWMTKEEVFDLIKETCQEVDLESMSQEELDTFLAEEYSIYSYERFLTEEYLTSYEEKYTTKQGDEVVAFGHYGYLY